MKVFIAHLDSSLGYSLSRLFAHSIVKPIPQSDIAQSDTAAATASSSDSPDVYSIHGTILFTPASSIINAAPMIYTGIKKRDIARKEAIDKYALPGLKPSWVHDAIIQQVFSSTMDRSALHHALLASDIIVYDLVAKNIEEAVWAAELLADASESFVKPKTFILVSTVMTWAKTKVDTDDTEAALTEEEYRRRKPHPNFKDHILAEKAIMKAGKKANLKTYIVAAGLVYHPGDSTFHYLFKSAWNNDPALTCYGDGNNILPTIHLDDLVKIIFEIAQTPPAATHYILAVDDSKHTLFEITKAISEMLGSGKVVKASKDHALLAPNLTQTEFDKLLANLPRIDAAHIKEMSFEWKCEAGLIENLALFIQEYKDARGLNPLKIVLHGPPSSGKTMLAHKLAAYYDILRIDVESVAMQALARLERNAALAATGKSSTEFSESKIESDRELWEEIQEAIANLPSTTTSSALQPTSAAMLYARLPQNYLQAFMREKLNSMPCLNQGYILDGCPTTFDAAAQLFKSTTSIGGEEDKVGGAGGASLIDPAIAPEHVISLNVTDEVIKERIMNLAESVVAGTKLAEDALVKRLEEFRLLNQDDNTVLNYFDEQEIHPLEIDMTALLSTRANDNPLNTFDAVLERIVALIVTKIGAPRNYGPSIEQITDRKKRQDEKNILEAEERVSRDKEDNERHIKSLSDWNASLEEVRKQEQDVLEAQSVPLRNYLMKYVMPTLTAGLIEVCKVRPEDPIDYLAEYLLKQNTSNSIGGGILAPSIPQQAGEV